MMRQPAFLILAVLAAVLCGMARAELQNVEVGGKIRIRGNYYNLDSLGDQAYVEQRTRLNVKADFTSDVTAFVELDSYDTWGEDFRSNYLTGADGRAVSNNDVEAYQAYIEARNLWGAPLTVRVGRQELSFGSQWLVGVNDASSGFWGLSFDALRLTYTSDLFTVDAFAAKLAETFGDFAKNDTDFYGVYGSYLGIEDVTLDAYWLYLRDDNATSAYETDLHTFGLRGIGTIGAFDFNAEVAYQVGGIDGLPSACPEGFGTADTDYNTFGAFLQLGYAFDMAWNPHVFARFSYLGGGDPDTSPWSNDRTLPFNRLFSNYEYTEFFANTDESNLLYYALGLDLTPTESVTLQLIGAYFQADVTGPDTGCWLWKDKASSDIGIETGLYANYQYSEDLVFRAGYIHFFGMDGLADSNFIGNGLVKFAGKDNDDYDYLFLETELSF